MMFLELFAPRGAMSGDELRALARRLTVRELMTLLPSLDDVLGAEEAMASADPGVMDLLDSIDHVVVHEIDAWIVGGLQVTDAAPRYVARAQVPASWRKGMSPFLVAAITRAVTTAVAEADPAAHPRVEVHVLGVPEGSYGLDGRVVGESALMDMISEARSRAASDAPPGVLVDPVCGMWASDTVQTLEHDGTTYGFCSPQCRKHFADRLAS